ncbi:MAG: ankyrin repeat domain-containing protein, partial [Kiritimatiellae bacterium]|nr:ankyrin repeat domain-containing protein [Kiritimatiellia bacterium]
AVLLIKSGADVTADTLLRAAQERSAAWDNGELMQSILDRGVDVNSTSDLGETALMAAVQKGLTDNVQWLLSRGADATLKDNSGKTAEDYTKDPKILEALRRSREENVSTE